MVEEKDDKVPGTRPSPPEPKPSGPEGLGDTSANTNPNQGGGFGQSAEPGMGELEKDTEAKARQSSTYEGRAEPAQPEADDPRTDDKAAAYRNRKEKGE